MKVLIALTYYAPYVSGVTEFARMLAEYLARTHDVTVLATQHDPALPLQEVVDGVRVIRSPVSLRLHKGVICPRFLADFRSLARQADVINLHLPMLEAGVLSYLCNRRRLVTMYQCDMAITGGLLDRAAVWAARLSGKVALRRAERVTVTTLDYARSSSIAAPCGPRLVEVRAPVKQPPAAGSGSPPAAPGVTRLGFVGRFVEEKGLPVLLEAFRSLVETGHEHLRLTLVGQSEGVAGGNVLCGLKSSIAALEDRVSVTGPVSEEELWNLYTQFDILVLPSINRYEAYGMVQIEAMFRGAVVVASDLPGVRTIIQRTGCGILARPGDAGSLALSILEAVELRQNISRDEVSRRAFQAYPPEASLEFQQELMVALAEAASIT